MKRKRAKRRKLPVQQHRSCGECTVCCTLLGVPELNKGAYEACSKLDGNCTVYSSRPKSCRDFECLWLQDIGLPEHRPDRSGLVLTVTVEDCILGKAGAVIVAHEAQPDAAHRPENAVLLQVFVDHTAVVITRKDGPRTVLSNDPIILRRAQNAARGST